MQSNARSARCVDGSSAPTPGNVELPQLRHTNNYKQTNVQSSRCRIVSPTVIFTGKPFERAWPELLTERAPDSQQSNSIGPAGPSVSILLRLEVTEEALKVLMQHTSKDPQSRHRR